MSAPRLEVRLDLIEHNVRWLVRRLGERGIGLTAVTKALLGAPELAAAAMGAGAVGLGDARSGNVRRLRRAAVMGPVTLVRSPMLSEASWVVASCDVSLNTEPAVLAALSDAAIAAGGCHDVVLMIDLGDRREGVQSEDLLALARLARDLPGVSLHGIGTNLACRNGVVPDAENMAELSTSATTIEAALGVELAVVSGGSSANLGWALGTGDVGRVNDLRIGEAMLLGVDPLDRSPIDGLRGDAVTIHAEVIESNVKPSMPRGRRAQGAFGSLPDPVDRGDVVQSIVALGRQDVDPEDLTAEAGTAVLAASSDHLVVESADLLRIGSEVVFRPGYASLLRAATSPFVRLSFTGAPST